MSIFKICLHRFFVLISQIAKSLRVYIPRSFLRLKNAFGWWETSFLIFYRFKFVKLTCFKSGRSKKLTFWPGFWMLQKKLISPSNSSLKMPQKTYIGSPMNLTYNRDIEKKSCAKNSAPPCISQFWLRWPFKLYF